MMYIITELYSKFLINKHTSLMVEYQFHLDNNRTLKYT